ncbi:MAG TPA: hypothetical protein VIS75_11190 [Chitinophagaceae bacterium]
MIIDRHNYEECFILYWDNELTASQKQAIENFVKENADLQEEFKLLGETRFTPDNNIQFEEKEFLLNNSFINITNYEDQLLNYIDDEVTADQRKEIEKFAGQYSSVKQELALFQKTKLQPEAEVVFPDKSILYRREEKPDSYRVRVISMTWFRVAVAAAIILIAGFATFRLINNNNGINKTEVVKVDEPKKQSTVNNSGESIINPVNQAEKDKKGDLVKGDEKSTKDQTIDKPDSKKQVDKKDDEKALIAYQPENKNNLPKEKKNIEPDVEADLPELKKDTRTAQANRSEANDVDFSKSVVTLTTIPTLDIPEADEKEKGGIKEFLRKTTRVFERRTRIQTTTDDNKLLVGAFAVSLK